MKKRVMTIATVALIALAVGMTSAWFFASESKANEFKLGTVKVKVVEEGFENLENVEATSYSKNVQVQSLGTKKTYIRVRLVPEWSDPSLSVSNVVLNLAGNSDWIFQDGHYYYKYFLTENQITSLLLESVSFTELGEEYDGAIFSLHVIAEGVQITNNGWKDIWGINSLPFTAGIEKP